MTLYGGGCTRPDNVRPETVKKPFLPPDNIAIARAAIKDLPASPLKVAMEAIVAELAAHRPDGRD